MSTRQPRVVNITVFKIQLLMYYYENRLAIWVPCAAYSLNLVGKVAAECCSSTISIFNFLEAIYSFLMYQHIVMINLKKLKIQC